MSGLTLLESSLTNTQKPPAGFHFAVIFFIGGTVPDALDMRFKKVSGLGSEIETITLKEGGENLYTHRLPNRVSYNNLILERGMVIGSPLNLEFNAAMSNYQFNPGNVLVALLDDDGLPLAAWLFLKTYPVKWSVSDLAAEVNGLVIETMELAYTRFQVIRI
ncbi:MAG: phage tail protein [Bacillota bacterium]|jgi:phage tail-like protein